MPELLAGWSKCEIPVPARYPLGGYIARRGVCQGSLDPLFLRVLILRQGRKTAAIFVADLLLISNDWAEEFRRRIARRLGARPDSILFAATHTHSAPLVSDKPFNFSSTRIAPRHMRPFLRSIEQRAERALQNALGSLAPVEISMARVLIHGVATDRNCPRRSRTQPFFMLKFRSPVGSAIFGSFGCHPTVLGARNLYASGDLHGSIARQLEKSADIALIANSAAANISTRFTRRDQTARELRRLAECVTEQLQAARFQRLSNPKLTWSTRRVRLPLGNRSADPPKGPPVRGRIGVVSREARLIRSRLAEAPEFSRKSITAAITILRIGNASFLALPFENFADTGKFLWQQARLTPVCYANGYWGYLPSASASEKDYEVISSLFGRQADEMLRRAAVALGAI